MQALTLSVGIGPSLTVGVVQRAMKSVDPHGLDRVQHVIGDIESYPPEREAPFDHVAAIALVPLPRGVWRGLVEMEMKRVVHLLVARGNLAWLGHEPALPQLPYEPGCADARLLEEFAQHGRLVIFIRLDPARRHLRARFRNSYVVKHQHATRGLCDVRGRALVVTRWQARHPTSMPRQPRAAGAASALLSKPYTVRSTLGFRFRLDGALSLGSTWADASLPPKEALVAVSFD